MPIITDQQVANAALAGGFLGPSLVQIDRKGEELVTAVAVALAESGGDYSATRRNANGSTDYGLWQINSVHLKPGGLLAGMDPAELTASPVVNARAAHAVFAAQGWRAWSAHNTGRYLLYVNRARAVAPTAESGGGGSGETITVNPLTQIGDTLENLGRGALWFSNPRNWLRISRVVIGGALVVVGLATVVSRSEGQPAAWYEAAKAATPVGKMTKGAYGSPTWFGSR